MTDAAWVPEVRDVPDELADKFDHADYPPKRVHFDPIAEKIDHATLAQLRELMHYGLGDTHADL